MLADSTSKIIAAVKDEKSLEVALKSKCLNIFLLSGEISTVKGVVEKCHQLNKKIYIHMDMIEGFGKDEAAVKFVHEYIKPDGIISTKPNLIKAAKQFNMEAIFRVFIVDTQSVETSISNINRCKPQYVEIMPGIIPELILMLNLKTSTKFICGGLVSSINHCERAFNAGAIFCSTSNQFLWNK